MMPKRSGPLRCLASLAYPSTLLHSEMADAEAAHLPPVGRSTLARIGRVVNRRWTIHRQRPSCILRKARQTENPWRNASKRRANAHLASAMPQCAGMRLARASKRHATMRYMHMRIVLPPLRQSAIAACDTCACANVAGAKTAGNIIPPYPLRLRVPPSDGESIFPSPLERVISISSIRTS